MLVGHVSGERELRGHLDLLGVESLLVPESILQQRNGSGDASAVAAAARRFTMDGLLPALVICAIAA